MRRQERLHLRFLQLDELLEAVLRRCIIFFVEGYVGKVIVGKGIHFRILLRGKRQVIVEVAGSLLHAVQAVIRFAPPIKGIRFGLQVILAQGDALVEIKDCPFKLRIGKVLGSQMEQDFLLGFQNGPAGMCNALNGFERGVIAACIHVHLYQIVAHLVGIGGVGKLVQEVFKDRNGLAECGVGCFVDAEGIIIGCLFFYFLVGVGCGGLFKSHTGFVLVGKLQVSQSHVQIGVLREFIFAGSHFAQDDGNLRIDSRPVIGHSQHIKCVPSCRRLCIIFQIVPEGFTAS